MQEVQEIQEIREKQITFQENFSFYKVLFAHSRKTLNCKAFIMFSVFLLFQTQCYKKTNVFLIFFKLLMLLLCSWASPGKRERYAGALKAQCAVGG